jgi:ABC-type nitrate/sulfonate/bicarbonate transport system substrate-binding protein
MRLPANRATDPSRAVTVKGPAGRGLATRVACGLGAGVVGLGALSACGSSGSSASADSSSSQKVNIAYSIIAADTGITWGMESAGFLKRNGLDASETYVASSSAVDALLSGQVQFAQVGGSDVVNASASGGKLTIIANLAPVHGYLLMVPNSITSASQLIGKKIGISGPGTTSDIETRTALADLGVNPSKVGYVTTSSSSNRVAALKAGGLDAAALDIGDALPLESEGFHSLINLAQRKAPAADTVIAVTDSYLASHHAVVQKFIDALVETIAYERSHESFTESLYTKDAKVVGQAILNATYIQQFQQILPSDYPDVQASQFTSDLAIMKSENPKLDDVNVSSMLDNSFVSAAGAKHLAG